MTKRSQSPTYLILFKTIKIQFNSEYHVNLQEIIY